MSGSWLFTNKYYQAPDADKNLLGQGGSSVAVERCFARATNREFAVKRLSPSHNILFPYLLSNELDGLIHIKWTNTPRIVKLINLLGSPTGEAFLILELINGASLVKMLECWRLGTQHAPALHQHEQQVMQTAAQLLQTVHLLHTDSNMAHLDITSSNIMLRNDDYQIWDQLRLVDFGFAQKCNKDPAVLDVIPQGATAAYAAPELLLSLQCQFEGRDISAGVPINGPSADWWAVGCVLFEILTGELPFKSKDCPAAVEAPQTVPVESRPQWEVYESMLQAQQTWVDACELAHTSQSGVQHPLLDRVRQCSTNPDQAALFFQIILSPVPQVRVKALEELWCAATVNMMFLETGTNFEAGTAAAMAALQKTNQKQKRGLCAALCACFSNPISQRQEDSSCPLPIRVLEAEGVTDDSTQLQTVASSVGCSHECLHDGQLETHTMQSAAQQTPAHVSLTQKCVRKLKSACRRKLKPSSIASTQQGVEGRDKQQTVAGDAKSPSEAVACSRCSTEQKQDAISKHSLQPGCVHMTVKAQSSDGCAVQQQLCHQQAESNEAELKPSTDRIQSHSALTKFVQRGRDLLRCMRSKTPLKDEPAH